jgi:hypothetical protein
MNASPLMTLKDRAHHNATSMCLREIEGGRGWVTTREIGQAHVQVGRACDVDAIVPFALAILENDPNALSERDGSRLLALAVLGLFASASIRNLEAGDPADAPR